MHTDKKINTQLWFWVFVILHIFFWTLAPALVRYALPIDAMEGTTWGNQLEWGYDKNPFMNAWLTELAIKIFGQKDWPIYLFSQLSVAIGFWSIWQLGRKFLHPIYALIAVFLLEGTLYFNLFSLDFNDNVLELGLWGLTILFFYNASKNQKVFDWVLTGFFAALSMMAKYFAAILLFPMLVFLLLEPTARKNFKNSGFYIGLILFIAIITPHFVWLFQHDFITLDYAFARVKNHETFFSHIYQPLYFALIQITTFLLSFLFFLPLLSQKTKQTIIAAKQVICRFDNLFLVVIGMGPFLLTLVLNILGLKLQIMWGTPLLSMWTICLITWTQPTITFKNFYNLCLTIAIFSLILLSSYLVSTYYSGYDSRVNFPGKIIAKEITEEWHHHYDTKLPYVIGPRWLSGSVSFYSTDRPSVYIDANPKLSPWIDEDKIKQNGAVIVSWKNENDHTEVSKTLLKRFPNAKIMPVKHFHWMRHPDAVPDIEVGIAIIPPKNTSK